MPEHNGSVDISEVNHPQRLEIVLEGVSYQDGFGADELVQRSPDVYKWLQSGCGVHLRCDAREAGVEVSEPVPQ